jgi:DNA-binding PadR family transcriptional regulator
MAPARRGDLTAKMAVLGLLVQRADTINNVKARLVEKFPGASWSRSVTYGAVSSLAEEGLVRVVAAGVERGLELYEATAEGVGSFARWLGDFSDPVLRDALRAKLEYVSDEDDLRAVIEAMREQEDACFEASEAAKVRLRRAIRRGELGSAKGAAWEGRLRRALMEDEAVLWHYMASRLQRLRESLEDPDEDGEGERGG